MERVEVRLSGAGGQGMILGGIILAESSTYHPELNVVQTQSYGPESRGGASRAEVVFSREEIDYPKVVRADILVSLTDEALQKYGDDVREDGIVIVDDKLDTDGFTPPSEGQFFQFPIFATARDEVGMELTANMVALGAVSHFLPGLEQDSIKNAIRSRVPEGTENKNLAAFTAGRELISKSL